MADSSTTGLTDQMVRESTIHANLGQELIVTTRDRLELCLVDHWQALESRQAWVIPFSIFVPVMLTLLTADFRDFGLKKHVWQAIFIIVAVVSFALTIRFALRGLQSWRSGKVENIDAIISSLKNPRPFCLKRHCRARQFVLQNGFKCGGKTGMLASIPWLRNHLFIGHEIFKATLSLTVSFILLYFIGDYIKKRDRNIQRLDRARDLLSSLRNEFVEIINEYYKVRKRYTTIRDTLGGERKRNPFISALPGKPEEAMDALLVACIGLEGRYYALTERLRIAFPDLWRPQASRARWWSHSKYSANSDYLESLMRKNSRK